MTAFGSQSEYLIDPYHTEAVVILAANRNGDDCDKYGGPFDKSWIKTTTLYMDSGNPIRLTENYAEKPDLSDDFIFRRLINERPELVWLHTENRVGDFLIGSMPGSLAYIRETVEDWNSVVVQLAFNNTALISTVFKEEDGGLEEARDFADLVASHFGSTLLRED